MSLAQNIKMTMGRQVGTVLRLIDQGVAIQKVDALTQLRRIKVCEGCDRFDAEHRQCQECGCEMDYKTTLAKNPVTGLLPGSTEQDSFIRCPLGKW